MQNLRQVIECSVSAHTQEMDGRLSTFFGKDEEFDQLFLTQKLPEKVSDISDDEDSIPDGQGVLMDISDVGQFDLNTTDTLGIDHDDGNDFAVAMPVPVCHCEFQFQCHLHHPKLIILQSVWQILSSGKTKTRCKFVYFWDYWISFILTSGHVALWAWFLGHSHLVFFQLFWGN